MTRLTCSFACAVALLLACTLTPTLAAEASALFVNAATGDDQAGANNCQSNAAPCKTITHALTQAATNDTISVAAGTYNLTLGEIFPLTIGTDLALTGAGTGSTILDATGANQRVVTVGSGTVSIAGVTITGGHVSCAAGGSDGCQAFGGGVRNSSTLTVTNSTVSGNSVSCTNSGTEECDAVGGGLHNDSMLTLTNNTVSGNSASCTNSGSGGCAAVGGGLNNGFPDGPPTMLTLTNSTVTANTVTCTGNCFAVGGGLGNFAGTTTLQNTIVAKQVAGADCADFISALTSNDFNLDSDFSCQLSQPGDHPGVSNPLLGPLQNNGGSTQTHALLPGSPAIDAGTNSGCPSTDQRAVARPQGAACDIGAFEFGVIVAAVELTGSAFHTGQQITYQATVNPGFTPTQADLYLGVLLPDGVTFLSFVPGPGGTIAFHFDSVPVPFAENVTLTPTVVPFAYTFTGTEPIGTYFTYAGLAVAGSDPLQAANQLSVGIQAFQFSP